jgi:hypothetical protein
MTGDEGLKLGQLVSAEAFYKYTVRVCKEGEVERHPTPRDYRPGRFVKVLGGDGAAIVGIIANVVIFNPEFNELMAGHKQEHLESFSPDLLEEQASFLSVVAVGTLGEDSGQGQSGQDPVNLTPSFHADVVLMSQDEIKEFHYGLGQRFQLNYLPHLKDMPEFGKAGLLHSFIGGLGKMFPEQGDKLSIIQKNMNWELRVGK